MSLTDRLPLSRIPDPVDAPPLRWCLIGTGWIAERFVDALQSKTCQRSVITTSLFSNTPTGATIAGTEGTITIAGIYYRPGGFTVASGDNQTTLSYGEPPALYAYLAYEAAETARRIDAGEKSTPYRPMADTVGTMEIIDEVRRQIGIVFPGEQITSASGGQG